MANTHQAGIKKDDHGGCSLDQQAEVKGDGLGGGHDDETTSMLKNCKKNSATDGGCGSSMIEILRRAAESVIPRHEDGPHHPSPPEPEGVQFVLHTLPVKKDCIGDGDGFTAYVKKAAGVAASGSYKKGDTNNLAPQQYRIRMRGIDAPELKMKYGPESRNELVKLIGGKCVTIHVYGMDQYERYLGDIYCDGIFIQEEMLKRGFSWYFKTGEKRPELARWEREAREARQGLWSLDNPQKPWEWKRDHPRNNKKEAANDIRVETLPWLISKDMETLGRDWKKKLEKFVAENMELNDHLQELKRKKNEAEDRVKELEKEMGSVVADNMILNDQLEESKKNKMKADDQILKLTFFSESVAAVNMDLHDKLEESKKNKNKADDQILKLTFFSESVAAINIDLHDKLEKLKKMNKKAEDRATESEKEMESLVTVNRELNDQVQELMGNKRLEELKKRNRKAED